MYFHELASVVTDKSQTHQLVYMQKIPNNPLPNDGDCAEDFKYSYNVKYCNTECSKLGYQITGYNGTYCNCAFPLNPDDHPVVLLETLWEVN